MGMIVLDRPVGPQFSNVQRSISSMEVCWLIFSVSIVKDRCGMLKKASWFRKRLSFFIFLGDVWYVM